MLVMYLGIVIAVLGLVGAVIYAIQYGYQIEDFQIRLSQVICLFGGLIGIFFTYLVNMDMKLDKILEKA
jgi:H+/Cl- antiporter ClcA